MSEQNTPTLSDNELAVDKLEEAVDCYEKGEEGKGMNLIYEVISFIYAGYKWHKSNDQDAEHP